MFNYIPEFFTGRDGRHRGGGRRLVQRQDEQPPHARPAPARRGRARHQRRGQGRPGQPARRRLPRHRHAARPPTTSSSRLPSMYHQFKELADVDITKEPMEVGPTAHYMMGGVRVDADTTATTVPGLFAAGEVGGRAARRQPARRQLALGPAGVRAAGRAARRRSTPNSVRRRSRPSTRRRSTRPPRRCSRRSSATGSENPYTIHADSRTACRTWSASSAPSPSWSRRWTSSTSSGSAWPASRVEGNRQYNPGWHLALDLHSMLIGRRGDHPLRRSSARRAAAATPATTSRPPTTGLRQGQRGDATHGRRHRASPGAAARDARRAQGAPRGEGK